MQQPASVAPQPQNFGLSAQSTGSSAPASALGQAAGISTPAVSAPQQNLAATSQPSSTVKGMSGQQAAVTGLQTPATQPMTSSTPVQSQGSSAPSSVPGQQSAATGGQSSADMQMAQQQVARSPLEGSATPAKQSAATSLSASIKALSRQQAGMVASEDTSLAAAPAEDDSKQQVRRAHDCLPTCFQVLLHNPSAWHYPIPWAFKTLWAFHGWPFKLAALVPGSKGIGVTRPAMQASCSLVILLHS